MKELFDLQGLMSRGSSKEWPSDLNKRIELSSSLVSWGPGLKNLLVKGITGSTRRLLRYVHCLRWNKDKSKNGNCMFQMDTSLFDEIVQFVLKVQGEIDQGVGYNILNPTL